MKKGNLLTAILIIGLCTSAIGRTTSFLTDRETSDENSFTAAVWDGTAKNYAIQSSASGQFAKTSVDHTPFSLGNTEGGKTGFTIEAWVYLPAYPPTWEGTIFHNGRDTFLIRGDPDTANKGKLWFKINGTYYQSETRAPLNEWVHVAAIHDFSTGELKFWLGGDLINTFPGIPVSLNGARPCKIGGDPGNSLGGYIDEFRFSDIVRYETAFTPNPAFTPDVNTELLYHFNEGTGTIINDSSGNSRNGFITPGTSWIER